MFNIIFYCKLTNVFTKHFKIKKRQLDEQEQGRYMHLLYDNVYAIPNSYSALLSSNLSFKCFLF